MTTETLDAPSQGIDNRILFGPLKAIEPSTDRDRDERALVVLRDGEELVLGRAIFALGTLVC